MKYINTPTNSEISVPENTLFISKTDVKGLITYANPDFIKISGYSELELLGKHHNTVRHPDMPRVIFRMLWQSIQLGREFNGYVKNMAKSGGYYWVLANITPSLSDDNEVIGYFSVRRKPDSEKLNYIQNLYLELLEIE